MHIQKGGTIPVLINLIFVFLAVLDVPRHWLWPLKICSAARGKISRDRQRGAQIPTKRHKPPRLQLRRVLHAASREEGWQCKDRQIDLDGCVGKLAHLARWSWGMDRSIYSGMVFTCTQIFTRGRKKTESGLLQAKPEEEAGLEIAGRASRVVSLLDY